MGIFIKSTAKWAIPTLPRKLASYIYIHSERKVKYLKLPSQRYQYGESLEESGHIELDLVYLIRDKIQAKAPTNAIKKAPPATAIQASIRRLPLRVS